MAKAYPLLSKKISLIIYCCCCCVICSIPTVAGIKWLVDNPGFDNLDAWSSEYLPCALDEVVFPYNYPAVMPLPGAVDVKGFILPANGAILLAADSTIELGSSVVATQRPCENGRAHRAYLGIPKLRKWYDSSSWQDKSNKLSNNKAVPSVEQMPCNNESLVMHANGPLAIDMENVAYMRLGQLNLAGSMLSKEYLQNLLNTDIGDILFRNTLGMKVEYYKRDVCGCQRDFGKNVEPICHNDAQTCARPHCLAPITPLGSCCAMCGATIRFRVDKCSDALANKLRATVVKALKQKQLLDKLDYHVNYYDLSELGLYMELVVADRREYNERSVKFIEQLQSETDWKAALNAEHIFQSYTAGRAYNPNVTFASFLMIVLCLVFVGFVCLVIFAHYAPDNRYIRRMPPWLYDPRRWQGMFQRSHFVFARFDNVAGGNVAVASVAGNVQESIIGYDTESGEVRERAFDNPMFSEMRKGNVPEQKAPDIDTNVESEAVAEDEQELTEIKLDSDTNDDDDDDDDGESDSDFQVETV